MNEFQMFLIAMLCCGLIDILFELLVIKNECKKVNYNCDECRNIKCYYHYCNKKRNELENK